MADIIIEPIIDGDHPMAACDIAWVTYNGTNIRIAAFPISGALRNKINALRSKDGEFDSNGNSIPETIEVPACASFQMETKSAIFFLDLLAIQLNAIDSPFLQKITKPEKEQIRGVVKHLRQFADTMESLVSKEGKD